LGGIFVLAVINTHVSHTRYWLF